MRRIALTLLTFLVIGLAAPAAAQGDAVVRGVIFYSPSCGHCHFVIEEHLPGLFESTGGLPEARFDVRAEDGPALTLLSNGNLELLMVNTWTDAGAALYSNATMDYRIPDNMLGVPRLVMNDEFQVGSGAIPIALDEFIGVGADQGGIDWPAITGLQEAMEVFGIIEADPTTTTTTTTAAPATTEAGSPTTAPATTEASATTTTTTTTTPFPISGDNPGTTDGIGKPLNTVWDKFTNDLAGNILSVVVLLGMLASLVLVVLLVQRGGLTRMPTWLVPLLAIAGMFVAVYLTYVETSGAEAVCGPVGNCNAVQESKFALLFGLIHVGLVGLISYAVVLGTWLGSRLLKAPWSDWAVAALGAGAAGGVAFSIYLTFLEPFVIGATCIWCLSSAVIVTALFWIAAGPAWSAWQRLRSA